MTYQVLARKWRPKSFQETVGQRPVLDALLHGLTTQKLHHAYLLTGTRGVGKTSIARILAKCMSCQRGITPEPCGVCEACIAIDQGRFMDLIEIDAASRTKVEDTRELLDHLQFSPSQGRFKIYLIDEVHMLSTHSFNALLKTLEEPPEHVKFILCTTDPQKIPATIISRCAHLALKPLSEPEISGRLQTILTTEGIPFESSALDILAQHAKGSLRDSLSLLDQAIATGDGSVTLKSTQDMLGVASEALYVDVLEFLLSKQVTPLCTHVTQLLAHGISGSSILDTLARMMTDIAHLQFDSHWRPFHSPVEPLLDFAQRMPKELVQLWYQILILATRELELAPSPQVGLEMTLIRMMAFMPAPSEATFTENQATPSQATPSLANSTQTRHNQAIQAQPSSPTSPEKSSHSTNPPWAIESTPATAVMSESAQTVTSASKPPDVSMRMPDLQPHSTPSELSTFWQQVVESSGLTGMIRPLARHCAPISLENQTLTVALDAQHAHLLNPRLEQQLIQALSPFLQNNLLKIMISSPSSAIMDTQSAQSPAVMAAKAQEAEAQQLTSHLMNDPVVRFAQENLGARQVESSIQRRETS